MTMILTGQFNNTYKRSFQYKLLNNVLFLNMKLHISGMKSSPLCSFCNLCDETPLHIFYECDRIKCLWSDLVQYFQNTLVLPTLKVQPCKLHKNIYMIASTQITTTEIFAFIAVLVLKLLSGKSLFINRKDNRNC